jgi:hypothetical protein
MTNATSISDREVSEVFRLTRMGRPSKHAPHDWETFVRHRGGLDGKIDSLPLTRSNVTGPRGPDAPRMRGTVKFSSNGLKACDTRTDSPSDLADLTSERSLARDG